MRIHTAATPGSDALVSLETTGGPLNGQCAIRTPAVLRITLCDQQLTVFPGRGTNPSGFAAIGLTGDTGDLPVTSVDYRDSEGRPIS